MLSKDVESLINDIGTGTLNESAIKGRLAMIQEQAEAQDAEIKKIKTELEYAEKRITALELELHEQESTQQTGRLKEGPEAILKLLFENDDPDFQYVGVMAEHLGIKKALAEHYCDSLYEAEMIGILGSERFYLAAKGRAYVVKYLLKE